MELRDQISPKYDSISTNHYFRISKKSHAEIDIIAKKGKVVDIYEVKCSYRITKAKHQLKRAKRILKATNAYFYCGSSGLLQLVEL